MKKIKNTFQNLIKFLKTNAYVRLILELILTSLLFNVNLYISLAFFAIVCIEIIFSTVENSLYSYLYLSFFDEVTQVDLLGGSISRILMIIILIKLLFTIIKNKIIPNKVQKGIIIFLIVSFIVGGITYKSINLGALIVLINIGIFVLYSMALKIKTKKQLENFIEKIFKIIILSVLASIAYGLFSNSFLSEKDVGGTVFRFKGTYEPNFMSMYINLGLFSLLTLKNKVKKILLYILGAVMVAAIFMTVSVTGIGTMGVLLLLYLIFKRKNFKEEFSCLFILGISSLFLFLGVKFVGTIDLKKDILVEPEQIQEENKIEIEEIQSIEIQKLEDNLNEQVSNNNILNRFNFLLDILKKGNLDRFTSGRIPITISFFNASFDRPIFNVLFGNDANAKKIYCNYFARDKYSHNSYMDFLYNFGVVGAIFVCGLLFKKVIKNEFCGLSLEKTKYSKDIKLIRIMFLIYAITLSMYTKRMFLIFFLL